MAEDTKKRSVLKVRSPSPSDILAALQRFPDVWRIAEKICAEHRVTVHGALCHRDRHPKATRARRAFLAIMRWSTDMSYPEVAELLGVDHTTVMEACRERERELAREYPWHKASA
jgi:chromosomal replication initiation ATPase DnaA